MAIFVPEENSLFCSLMLIHTTAVAFREALGGNFIIFVPKLTFLEGLIIIISKLKESYNEIQNEENESLVNNIVTKDPFESYRISRNSISKFFIMKIIGVTIGTYIGGYCMHFTMLKNM